MFAPERAKEATRGLALRVIDGLAEMHKDRNETPLSVQELHVRIFDVWMKSWRAGTEHSIGGEASADHIVQTACLLANHGQANRIKEAGLYDLVARKYKSAEGTLKLLKQKPRDLKSFYRR